MRYQKNAHVVAISSKNVQMILMAGIAFVVMTFLMIAMLTTAGNHIRFSSSAIHDWTQEMQSDWFVRLMGSENRYYLENIEADNSPSFATALFEVATNVNLEDPRTFLGRELPGFSAFDDRLAIAGEGTDYTTMSIESAPPREAFQNGTQQEQGTAASDEDEEEGDSESEAVVEDAFIHIIHSHNRESFYPEIENDESPFHAETNITQVGEYLGDALRDYGLPVEVSNDDIQSMLDERDWGYHRSYEAAREVVKEAKADNEDLEFFFDLHRDSQPRSITTATINEEVYARTFFVVGEDHPDYEKNLALAEELHEKLEERWPGLSRGVLVRGGAKTNGIFNQDLSENALLIEIGGVENTFEELYQSADVLAEVIQGYIHDEVESDDE